MYSKHAPSLSHQRNSTYYGPVYSTWCFAFEIFNGVFKSFQKNWIYPEVQLLSKFLNFRMC